MLACTRLEVGVAGCGEDVDGVFLGVGVEVADQEDLVRALGGLEVLGEGEERFSLLGAGNVRGALALVRVIRGGGGGALDLKWFTIAMNFLSSSPPTGLKTCASGLRALAKATVSLWMMDSPTGSATAFL